MDAAKLEEIERRLEDGPERPWTIISRIEEDSRGRPTGRTEYFVRFGGPPGELSEDTTLIRDWATAALIASAPSDLAALLAFARALLADNEAMKAAFSDACLDKEPLRLAREEGRLEVLLKWAKETILPVLRRYGIGFGWARAFGDSLDPTGGYLTASVFDLLEGGTLDDFGAQPERLYPTENAAAIALLAACRKRARSPPGGRLRWTRRRWDTSRASSASGEPWPATPRAAAWARTRSPR